jgi:hypothetical protein
MLHCDKFTGKNEQITTEAEEALATVFLQQGKNVIIDDTNLNPKTLNRLKAIWASHEVVDMTDVSIDECIKRDLTREKKVGAHVIYRMAMQYLDYLKDKKVVICDLDGTLCNIDHRLHFVKDGQRDWKSFFEHISEDSVRDDVWEDVRDVLYYEHAELVFVSGRPDDHRHATEWWLTNVADCKMDKIPLFMRMKGDHRPDTEVKADIYDKLLSKTNVIAVFDDRPSVIRMWKLKGLNVIDVGTGVEF